MARIGIMALQGAFEAHAQTLTAIGHQPVLVRSESHLGGIDGLVFPGGESSVQLDLISRLELEAPLLRVVASGCPVLATCAGLILASSSVRGSAQRTFGWVDVTVARNAWGRQKESFEATSDRGRPVVFIRAPRIVAVGVSAEVLDGYRGEPIMVRQRNVTCVTFHPELTADTSLHSLVFGEASSPAPARAMSRARASVSGG